jgi:hypothetical protein
VFDSPHGCPPASVGVCKNKKTDVTETPKAFDYVGLLIIAPTSTHWSALNLSSDKTNWALELTLLPPRLVIISLKRANAMNASRPLQLRFSIQNLDRRRLPLPGENFRLAALTPLTTRTVSQTQNAAKETARTGRRVVMPGILPAGKQSREGDRAP